ncbi:hypothetical protein ABBQ38_011153 [Trebouxia sp. C0009 RCD-2024]
MYMQMLQSTFNPYPWGKGSPAPLLRPCQDKPGGKPSPPSTAAAAPPLYNHMQCLDATTQLEEFAVWMTDSLSPYGDLFGKPYPRDEAHKVSSASGAGSGHSSNKDQDDVSESVSAIMTQQNTDSTEQASMVSTKKRA